LLDLQRSTKTVHVHIRFWHKHGPIRFLHRQKQETYMSFIRFYQKMSLEVSVLGGLRQNRTQEIFGSATERIGPDGHVRN